ncbi:hypothetical protein PC123_g10364 [Phytophthora cactorum]|nr:hypothetical protein PC123_g10364 [Phytophthora cactorum]
MDNSSVTTSVLASTGLNGTPECTPCSASTVVMVPTTVVSPNPEIRMFLIDPPPESLYDSYKDVESALHAWTKANSYNVSKRTASYLPASAKIKFAQYFECDGVGKPKPTDRLLKADRVRTLRESKRIGCPMTITLCAVSKKHPEGKWAIVHSNKGARGTTTLSRTMPESKRLTGNVQ